MKLEIDYNYQMHIKRLYRLGNTKRQYKSIARRQYPFNKEKKYKQDKNMNNNSESCAAMSFMQALCLSSPQQRMHWINCLF